MRGVIDPDILVKRPPENPGGMTVTIFKVGMMDGVKIIWFWRIPFFQYFHYSTRIPASRDALVKTLQMSARLASGSVCYVIVKGVRGMINLSKVCEACSEEFCHGACVLFDYSHQVSFATIFEPHVGSRKLAHSLRPNLLFGFMASQGNPKCFYKSRFDK